jgi:hypothetical protein
VHFFQGGKLGWRNIKLDFSCNEPHKKPRLVEVRGMCRNIKTLFNFDPPVTGEEIQAASLQFVRKISGFNKPSRANETAFLAAVDEIAGISARLIHSLETNAPPRNREERAAKAEARALGRVVLESAKGGL